MERKKAIDEIGFSDLTSIVIQIQQKFQNHEEILMPYYIIDTELEKDEPNFCGLINKIDQLLFNLQNNWIKRNELVIFESLKTYIWKNAFWGTYVKKEIHKIIYL